MKRKSPGVYIEEISGIALSVTEVETSIPAFTGYSEKAKAFADGDLYFIPKKYLPCLSSKPFMADQGGLVLQKLN